MDDVQYEEMQDLEFGDEHEPDQGPRAQAVPTGQAPDRTQQEAAKAAAVTRVPRMKRKLTAAVLKGKHPERGHYLELVQDAAELFWKEHRGCGHEVHDVRLLMKLYRSWHKCIYPEEKSFRNFARRIANNSDLKRGLGVTLSDARRLRRDFMVTFTDLQQKAASLGHQPAAWAREMHWIRSRICQVFGTAPPPEPAPAPEGEEAGDKEGGTGDAQQQRRFAPVFRRQNDEAEEDDELLSMQMQDVRRYSQGRNAPGTAAVPDDELLDDELLDMLEEQATTAAPCSTAAVPRTAASAAAPQLRPGEEEDEELLEMAGTATQGQVSQQQQQQPSIRQAVGGEDDEDEELLALADGGFSASH